MPLKIRNLSNILSLGHHKQELMDNNILDIKNLAVININNTVY